MDAQQGVRAGLAAVWDDVYGDAYTDGFSDKEESEIHSELLEKYGWAPHYTMWFEGASEDEALAMMDVLLDAADAANPGHVTIGAIGALGPGNRHEQKKN